MAELVSAGEDADQTHHRKNTASPSSPPLTSGPGLSSAAPNAPRAPSVSQSRRPSMEAVTSSITASATSTPSAAPSAKRLYRAADNKAKWVTRDIAALDFLLGIPLEQEASIVERGWESIQIQQREQQVDSDDSDTFASEHVIEVLPRGRWWEKWINNNSAVGYPTAVAVRGAGDDHVLLSSDQLERPTREEKGRPVSPNKSSLVQHVYAPGRRLQGDKAVRVQIPLTTTAMTKQKSIARLAALREWELKTAHGLNTDEPPMLDGRLFFSAKGSYPVSVFSMIRYEPKKEEAALRRQKLEARGGGGSQFIFATRDWRGISYRSLLPQKRSTDGAFNRFLKEGGDDEANHDADDASTSSMSSEDSDVYHPGLLDDPDMVLGRHRNVMIGDRVTGPMVASHIQFVEPALLKAELNKQFRERFDGWEPPKSARKYIGAKVIGGNYVLMDPTEEEDRSDNHHHHHRRSRQGSITSLDTENSGPKEKQIRMPPSLTLSKIRSLKHQALMAAVRAKLEIGTVALACVYFERLCLDCRVDKSNRRLSFAACLLLSIKVNEPNIGLVVQAEEEGEDSDSAGGTNMTTRLQSLVRPNKRSNTMFASLLEFFTEEWSLNLKHLFDAEWAVFAALGFSLLATPSQVAFHFKRMMKTLEWNPRNYLGEEMYLQWQSSLKDEEKRREERERRKELQRHRKEEELLNLHIEIENEVMRRKAAKKDEDNSDNVGSPGGKPPVASDSSSPNKSRKSSGIKLFHRFGMRRIVSQERLSTMPQSDHPLGTNQQATTKIRPGKRGSGKLGIPLSPSMPMMPTLSTDGVVAIDMPDLSTAKSDTSVRSVAGSDEEEGIMV